MNAYILEPLDLGIFGTGQPFSQMPGAVLHSLPLPLPGTVAGAARTRAGQDARGRFVARPEDVLRIALRGPLPVLLDRNGAPRDFLVPAPADALAMGDGAGIRIHPLQPLELPEGYAVGPERAEGDAPLSVGPPSPLPGKPASEAPPLWRWSSFIEWLLDPAERPLSAVQGARFPEAEPRVHVSVDPETGTAREHHLFATQGRSWWSARRGEAERRLALWLEVGAALPEGPGPLGGEGHLARWSRSELRFPEPPAELLAAAREGWLRLVLLTPGRFERGAQPGWLLQTAPSGTRLLGRVNGRAVVVSGWDYARRRPKPTRRLVPAGAVYFLQLGGSPDEREAWTREHWGQAVSDGEQDRLDGLGLAVFGRWNGPVPFSPTSPEVTR